jgi:hypothetical protein
VQLSLGELECDVDERISKRGNCLDVYGLRPTIGFEMKMVITSHHTDYPRTLMRHF